MSVLRLMRRSCEARPERHRVSSRTRYEQPVPTYIFFGDVDMLCSGLRIVLQNLFAFVAIHRRVELVHGEEVLVEIISGCAESQEGE